MCLAFISYPLRLLTRISFASFVQERGQLNFDYRLLAQQVPRDSAGVFSTYEAGAAPQ